MRDTLAALGSSSIMMVDDEPTTLDVMEMFLREAGYARFAKTTDAGRVLEEIRAKRPDLLLLNLVMPELGGFAVLEGMRADASLRGIPVILVTSSTDAETKKRAMALGASDFLGKPVDRSELVLRVRNTLAAKAYRETREHRARRREVRRPAAFPGAPPLESRLDASDARCRKIIGDFTERLEAKLLAMETCFDAGDLAELETLAHWLKGAAGTVGFDTFTQPAEALRALASGGKEGEINAAIGAIRDMADRIVVPTGSEG